MNPPNSPPRWTRQLAEDEAVWTAYERRRLLRAAFAILAPAPDLPPEEADRLDWLAAEHDAGRTVEAHGHWADEAR